MNKPIFFASLAIALISGCGGSPSTSSSSIATTVSSSIVVSSSSTTPSSNTSVITSSSSVITSSSVVASSSSLAASSSSVAVSSSAPASSSSAHSVDTSTACTNLVSDQNINWNESGLGNEQAIVKCLSDSLGKPIGYGEHAMGGYDPAGNSHLVVIKKNTGVLPEKQFLDAINSTAHNWIVFDKDDYKNGGDIAMYRLYCDDAGVLTALGGASQAECLDHTLWCSNRGINDEATCALTFFTEKLNDSNLPIRAEMINSNTTIDGRGAKARILFQGFKVGADAEGASTVAAQSVIITHMLFQGAFHEEDHGLDPDLLRITGESHDIWVHKNSFEYSGDSAFDVKVGAYDVTFSFNKIVDVVRTSLHGSEDSRVINANITTTMHNNLFLTSEEFHSTGKPGDKAAGSTGRRTPLIRRGVSHSFNNVYFNYYKEFASVRVGATLMLEDNVFLASDIIKNRKDNTQASFDEWLTNLTKGLLSDGAFASSNGLVAFAKGNCEIDTDYQGLLPAALGNPARDLKEDYSSATMAVINQHRFSAGQDLIDYVKATAGHDGELSYLSPRGKSRAQILALARTPCM